MVATAITPHLGNSQHPKPSAQESEGSLRNTGACGLVSLGSDERLCGREGEGQENPVEYLARCKQSFPDPALPGPVSGKGSGPGNKHGGAGLSIHYRHASET